MSRLTVTLAIATVVGAAALSDATPPDRVTALYGGLASMTLPAGWEEIPPDHLEELSMWVAEITDGRSVEVFQHGYRPVDRGADPWLPHLLVQIVEGGRLSYASFLGDRSLAELRDRAGRAVPNALPPLVLGVTLEQVGFDRARMCLRLEHALDLKVRGPVRVLTAAFLTERGLVILRWVDRTRRIEADRATFDAVVDSVVIDPEIAYRPRLRDRWPGLPFFVAAGAVAVVLIAYLVRRRRSE